MNELKPGNKLLEFLSLRSKKIIISIVVPVAIIVLGFIFYFGYWTQRPQYVVAKVGDTVITKGNVDSGVGLYKKFYQYNKDSKNLSTLNTTVRDILVEKAVVNAEATKKNISVSDKEVDARLATIQGSYKSYDDMLKSLNVAYGFNESSVRELVKYSLLKDKVASSVVATKNVTLFYYRYDFPASDAETLARAAVNDSFSRIQGGSSLETEYARVKSLNNPLWAMPNTGFSTLKNLNKETASVIFEGNEDWPAIDALTKVGSYTGIVKSSGGYLAIYRLDSLGSGGYTSWEGFMSSYPKTLSERIIENMLASVSIPAYATGGCVSGLEYYATGGYCKVPTAVNDQAHYSSIFGVVRDAVTGLPLDGATVTAKKIIDPNLQPPLQTSTSPDTFTDTTRTTSISKVSGYYMLGNDNGTRLIPCYWQWDVTASLPGYSDNTTRIALVNGQNYALYPYITPLVRIFGAGIVTDTNFDGAYEPDSAGGTVSWPDYKCPETSCSGGYYNKTVIYITANTNPGYVFVGLRLIYDGVNDYRTADLPETIDNTSAPGYSLHTNNPHGIYMDRNWQAIAYFRKLPTLSIGIVTDFNDGRGYVGDSTGGSVRTADGRIACVPACSATYNLGDFVSTTETPATGYEFVKWDTTDSGGGTASYTVPTIGTYMTLSKGFTAFFRKSAPVIPLPTPTLSCTVSPPNGETPLVVRVSANPGGGVTGPYNYKMNAKIPPVPGVDELNRSNMPSPFWYTYSTAGRYTVQISSPSYQGGATWETCTAINSSGTSSDTITVTDPSSTTGGEVRP